MNPWLGGKGEITAIKRLMGQQASINMEASGGSFSEHKSAGDAVTPNSF
jgi:hypothetical protein